MAKVLIIEDNPTFRRTLKEMLETGLPSLTVEEAGDGKTGLEKLEAFLPDLAIVDIKLPGANGLEVTKKIKRDYAHVVVVILTHYDLPEYRKAAFDYGASHFLSKGETSHEEIVAVVRSVISGGEGRT